MSDKKDPKDIHVSKLVERQKEASIVRKIVLVCFIVLILIIGGAVFGAYQYVMGALEPVDETDDEMIEVNIPIGSSTTGIGEILAEHDLINSSTLFRVYVRYRNEEGFQAGDYELSRSMDMDEIITELKEGTVYQDYELTFTIPEGRWLEQIVGIVSNETNIEAEELADLLQDEEYIEDLIERYTMLEEVILDEDIRYPLEGYLFPARYDFVDEEITPEQLVETMLDRTAAVLDHYEVGSQELSYHEVLTIASIIEGEARNDEERERVSGVISNRIIANMPLQMDPTIAYAHGEHFSRTLNEHLEIDSPYNTYRNTGLPPGPINNPGEQSIRAALAPENHGYLYFYHSPEGEVFFTETYEEHQEVLREHRPD
ncbi:endolytic transglycosylase MltG [Evansella clarkii]|uniref:endolytic transglycosylase MltG n=1 Tax=Evansella clarkii TaxID=79879 RepID=UPI0009968E67|nr:endolytic transglycosylase MltG [Evansella clarkii]